MRRKKRGAASTLKKAQEGEDARRRQGEQEVQGPTLESGHEGHFDGVIKSVEDGMCVIAWEERRGVADEGRGPEVPLPFKHRYSGLGAQAQDKPCLSTYEERCSRIRGDRLGRRRLREEVRNLPSGPTRRHSTHGSMR